MQFVYCHPTSMHGSQWPILFFFFFFFFKVMCSEMCAWTGDCWIKGILNWSEYNSPCLCFFISTATHAKIILLYNILLACELELLLGCAQLVKTLIEEAAFPNCDIIKHFELKSQCESV